MGCHSSNCTTLFKTLSFQKTCYFSPLFALEKQAAKWGERIWGNTHGKELWKASTSEEWPAVNGQHEASALGLLAIR